MDMDLLRVVAAAFCFWVASDVLSRPGWGPGPWWRESGDHQQPGQLCARFRPLFSHPQPPTEVYLLEIILDIYTLV